MIFIAQEVDQAAKGTFSGVDKNGEYMGMRYAELVKAIQEQEAKIQALDAKNEALSQELAAIKTMLAQSYKEIKFT